MHTHLVNSGCLVTIPWQWLPLIRTPSSVHLQCYVSVTGPFPHLIWEPAQVNEILYHDPELQSSSELDKIWCEIPRVIW